jgi:hypothetical protein
LRAAASCANVRAVLASSETKPVPLPNVDLWSIILVALLNPAVPVVAFWMGRHADQVQKLFVAAFAASLIGSALVYVVVWLGVAGTGSVGRAAAGIFVAQFVIGLGWALLGYSTRRRA